MSKKQIEDVIRSSIEVYFKDLRGNPPADLHDLLIGIIEKPLEKRNPAARAWQPV